MKASRHINAEEIDLHIEFATNVWLTIKQIPRLTLPADQVGNIRISMIRKPERSDFSFRLAVQN